MKPTQLLLSLVITLSFQVQAASSVWQVQQGEHKLYLGGTVHVLSSSDYPLPPEFAHAYARSDVLVLETDMAQFDRAEFQQRMLRELSYPPGQDLSQVLSPSVYQQLAEYCTSRGIGMHVIKQFKPSMAAMMLTMAELKRLDFAGSGVDKYFYSQALLDGKPLAKLETANEQLAYIANMGVGNENEFIRYSLADMQGLRAFMDTMKMAWRTGDVAQFNAVAIEPMQDDFPKLYQDLLVERNNNWLPQIKQMLENDRTELVLVGALHLFGDDGLLTKLQAAGYQVEPLVLAP